MIVYRKIKFSNIYYKCLLIFIKITNFNDIYINYITMYIYIYLYIYTRNIGPFVLKYV